MYRSTGPFKEARFAGRPGFDRAPHPGTGATVIPSPRMICEPLGTGIAQPACPARHESFHRQSRLRNTQWECDSQPDASSRAPTMTFTPDSCGEGASGQQEGKARPIKPPALDHCPTSISTVSTSAWSGAMNVRRMAAAPVLPPRRSITRGDRQHRTHSVRFGCANIVGMIAN